MKNLIFSLLSTFLVLLSCSKDEPDTPVKEKPDPTITQKEQVLAGIYDSKFDYHEYNPPRKLNYILDTFKYMGDSDYFKVAIDSIDINSDGNYDLTINLKSLQDWEFGREIKPGLSPNCDLQLKNGLEIAMLKYTYQVPHDNYSTVYWADTLNYKKRIDDMDEWSTTIPVSMWYVSPDRAIGPPPHGSWFYITNMDRYIGIRMKMQDVYKYGWIKIHKLAEDDFEIVSFAIQK